MADFYSIAFIVMLGLLCLGGLIMLIIASVRYGTNPLWWITSLILCFIPGYTAYFSLKGKYLEKGGFPAEKVKAAKTRASISLFYIVATWLLLAIVCAVVIISARNNPEVSTYRIQSLFFWALVVTSAVYVFLLLIIKPSSAR